MQIRTVTPLNLFIKSIEQAVTQCFPEKFLCLCYWVLTASFNSVIMYGLELVVWIISSVVISHILQDRILWRSAYIV